jgi:hypothetical protein
MKPGALRGLTAALPPRMRGTVDRCFDIIELVREMKNPRVLASLGPSGLRGLLLQRGRSESTVIPLRHEARFDWRYPQDHAEMRALVDRAQRAQWIGATTLPWATSVDPVNPEVPLLADDFLDFTELGRLLGHPVSAEERLKLKHSVVTWMMSQFLHGEQGALFAAAQVTECVPFFDGKLFGATQVMDEARHVEVFRRYTEDKLGKLYTINDNLFVIIDALMRDSRWDMKFLGMQIMVEGLALGAFGALYKATSEPLLRDLLRYVIRDEARHVHYGVLALREYFRELSSKELREREDWSFEVALLMRNRFLVWEVYEEWFEGRLTRDQWRNFVTLSPGMMRFRNVMFSRLVPNLREIGLISPRVRGRYEEFGLLQYIGGPSADRLDEDRLVSQLDPTPSGQTTWNSTESS